MYRMLIPFGLLALLLLICSGCDNSSSRLTPPTARVGKVQLSIIFPTPSGRTIPEATKSILITATGDRLLADKPFRKGFDRPGLTQPQQIDAELILPLGAKNIRADARDVSAADAERYNSGNTLATAQQNITLTDINFFEPIALTLDLQPTTPTLTKFSPSFGWVLKNYADGEVPLATGSAATFTRTDTRKVYFYSPSNFSADVTTNINLAANAPVVTQGQNFTVTLTLTRSISSVPAEPLSFLWNNSNIGMSIPNATGGSVASGASPSNPLVISLKLDFKHQGNNIYHIDMTADPGFAGYVSGIFIPHGALGGYASNWNIATFAGTTGITLNGNINLFCYVTGFSNSATNNELNKIAYVLRGDISYRPVP